METSAAFSFLSPSLARTFKGNHRTIRPSSVYCDEFVFNGSLPVPVCRIRFPRCLSCLLLSHSHPHTPARKGSFARQPKALPSQCEQSGVPTKLNFTVCFFLTCPTCDYTSSDCVQCLPVLSQNCQKKNST